MLAGSVSVFENLRDLFRKRISLSQLPHAEGLAYFLLFPTLQPQRLFLDLKKKSSGIIITLPTADCLSKISKAAIFL